MPTNITAAAVLSIPLMLPIFQDVAKKCELDVGKPLKEYRITERLFSDVSSTVHLTFEDRFMFSWFAPKESPLLGNVSYGDGAHLPGSRHLRGSLPDYVDRRSLLTTNQALRVAETALLRLSLATRMATMQPPEREQYYWGDPAKDGKPLPFFKFTWYPQKTSDGLPPQESWDGNITVHVSGLNKRVSGMSFGPCAWQHIDLTKYHPHLTNAFAKPKPDTSPPPAKK